MPLGAERERGRGVFVVLDGVDGCGKSTQASRLARALSERGGGSALHLREPGSTKLGESLRGLLLGRQSELSPAVEALLFAAARRQMLDELVIPALAAGRPVVCERFHPSTFAYQAFAGGLDEEAVLAMLERFAGSPRPDLVILLDLPVAAAAARRGSSSDRIEDRGLAFQERVAEGFRRWAGLARAAGWSVAEIDGSRPAPDVARAIEEEVGRALR